MAWLIPHLPCPIKMLNLWQSLFDMVSYLTQSDYPDRISSYIYRVNGSVMNGTIGVYMILFHFSCELPALFMNSCLDFVFQWNIM